MPEELQADEPIVVKDPKRHLHFLVVDEVASIPDEAFETVTWTPEHTKRVIEVMSQINPAKTRAVWIYG